MRAAPLRERWRRLSRAAGHLVPAAIVVFIIAQWNGIPGQGRDTITFHRVATACDAAIYEPIPPTGPHEFVDEWYYLYPPPLAALLSGLPDVSYRTFDRGWLLLNVLAFWVLAAALARIARPTWSWDGTARWGAALFFMPGTLLTLHFANIDIMILALVGLGLAFPGVAGLTLGLGAAFKVTPMWPLLTLALRRPRRTLPGVAGALVVCLGACLLAFGATGTATLVVQWVREIMPTVAQGQFWGESFSRFSEGGLRPGHYLGNLSPSFTPVQLSIMWGWWGYEGGPLPGPVRAYLTGIAIAAPLIAAWMTRYRSPNVQAAVVMAAALFSAPIVRPYALPVVLLILAAVWQERRGRVDRREHRIVKPAGYHR